jgi:hypothetical protein
LIEFQLKHMYSYQTKDKNSLSIPPPFIPRNNYSFS